MRDPGDRTNCPQPALLVVGCLACCLAFGETQWAQPEATATISTHFNGTALSRSGSTVLTLNHDQAVTIRASVTTTGDETLTSSGNDTLTTAYKLTGVALGGSADDEWVSSSAFISPQKSYSVAGIGPSQITFWVCATAAADRANDAGTYSARVILTATW